MGHKHRQNTEPYNSTLTNQKILQNNLKKFSKSPDGNRSKCMKHLHPNVTANHGSFHMVMSSSTVSCYTFLMLLLLPAGTRLFSSYHEQLPTSPWKPKGKPPLLTPATFSCRRKRSGQRIREICVHGPSHVCVLV